MLRYPRYPQSKPSITLVPVQQSGLYMALARPPWQVKPKIICVGKSQQVLNVDIADRHITQAQKYRRLASALVRLPTYYTLKHNTLRKEV